MKFWSSRPQSAQTVMILCISVSLHLKNRLVELYDAIVDSFHHLQSVVEAWNGWDAGEGAELRRVEHGAYSKGRGTLWMELLCLIQDHGIEVLDVRHDLLLILSFAVIQSTNK